MKNIHIIYTEGEIGEAQGAFDEDGNILDVWSCNDATWRNEYFSGFMAKLGINVIEHMPEKDRAKLEKKLIAYCKKNW